MSCTPVLTRLLASSSAVNISINHPPRAKGVTVCLHCLVSYKLPLPEALALAHTLNKSWLLLSEQALTTSARLSLSHLSLCTPRLAGEAIPARPPLPLALINEATFMENYICRVTLKAGERGEQAASRGISSKRHVYTGYS